VADKKEAIAILQGQIISSLIKLKLERREAGKGAPF